jgi:GNAT superfamily N-acetyltransferase
MPLSDDDDDARLWLGFELASLIEGHLHHIVDLNVLSSVERSIWERRVTGDGERLLDPRADEFRRAYWLLDAGVRAGTLAMESRLLGRSEMGLSSLYVRPDLRRKGIAARAIDAAYTAAVAAGSGGLLISTDWCWQHAVCFYARLGLWVRSWKHSLVFVRRDDLWPYRVEIDGTTATYSVLREGTWTRLLEAENRGAVLGWTELPAHAALREPRHRAYTLAPGTFALHLKGWPLVRSPDLWERRGDWSDLGMPEGLACKITVFEGIARARGYQVRTPRIPGVSDQAAAMEQAGRAPAETELPSDSAEG